MKYSIRKQFAIIFIGLMSATVLLCWFINNTFLERYYMQNKQQALLFAYHKIADANSAGNVTSDAFDIELQKMCNRYNISVLIVDANNRAIKSTTNNTEFLIRELLDNIFEQGNKKSRIIYENPDFVIQKTVDNRTQTEFLEMWGIFENKNLFLMRTAIEGIKDSVAIANRFLAYVGIFSALLGAIVIYFVSKKVAQPIMELADISNRMSNLDFEVRYDGSSKNEVALLGENINKLSATLQTTISELKTANNELKQDIAKKNEIDEMRKEFLSNVSHELKTPIALIQGYAEGLRDGINDDQESKDFYCEVIVDEAAKMNIMVKKLMTLNQLEFGKDVLQFERFDIMDLIKNQVQSTEILIKQRGVQIQIDQFDSIYVWADEFQVEEVLRNYLSNALNHVNDEKQIRVRVIPNIGSVRIGVFNTGNQIPVESLPYLWDKFYKVDKARTREYGGSGVGLSIVKAIMESMNQPYGVINYQNGVEFWFELETK